MLRSVRPHTWVWLSYCHRLRRRAADAIERMRAAAAERARVLLMIQRAARALRFDVGYDAETGLFEYRSQRGVMLTVHPAVTDAAQSVPAYAADGSVVDPLQPPDASGFVLAPEANGGWC